MVLKGEVSEPKKCECRYLVFRHQENLQVRSAGNSRSHRRKIGLLTAEAPDDCPRSQALRISESGNFENSGSMTRRDQVIAVRVLVQSINMTTQELISALSFDI